MKLLIAMFAIFTGLTLVSCTENQPGAAGARGSAVSSLANKTSPQQGISPPVERSPAPPQGAEWTIFCDKVSGAGHVERSQEFKNELIRTTGRSDFYIVHHDDDSTVYFGFYGEIVDSRKPQEMRRAKADLRQLATLTDKFGNPLFRAPCMMRLEAPDPDAPPDWNLANTPPDAFWSLQVCAYKDSIDRKKVAVDSVREARKQGIPAYYYHGESISSVCIGTWPREAVKEQVVAPTDDPQQTVIVIGGSRAPENISPEVRDANGEKMRLIAPKLDITDPSLQAAIKQFPNHEINGELHGKRAGDQIIYDPSFLVEIPHSKSGRSMLADQSRQPADAEHARDLPPTLQGFQDPDPTLGALRSLGGEMILDLLIASGNPGKVREFREMVGGDRFNWRDLSGCPDCGTVEETGRTFRRNACLKASYYARRCGPVWALADDSGLEVDALNGAPGVLSARWAAINGTGSGDADNNATLLRQLDAVPDERRAARFVCVLALADPQAQIVLTVRETVEGRILRLPRGANGFGYDPLFLIEELGQTTAELSPQRKHEISHRGRALRRLRELMAQAGLG